jgi:hypothetical protein
MTTSNRYNYLISCPNDMYLISKHIYRIQGLRICYQVCQEKMLSLSVSQCKNTGSNTPTLSIHRSMGRQNYELRTSHLSSTMHMFNPKNMYKSLTLLLILPPIQRSLTLQIVQDHLSFNVQICTRSLPQIVQGLHKIQPFQGLIQPMNCSKSILSPTNTPTNHFRNKHTSIAWVSTTFGPR